MDCVEERGLNSEYEPIESSGPFPCGRGECRCDFQLHRTEARQAVGERGPGGLWEIALPLSQGARWPVAREGEGGWAWVRWRQVLSALRSMSLARILHGSHGVCFL